MRNITIVALLAVLLSTLFFVAFVNRQTQEQPSSTSPDSASEATLASFGTTYDIDHLPMFIDVYDGQTISFVRFGNSKTNARFTVYENDGKGMLLLQMHGGPIGTVASFRTLRRGEGQILIHFTGSGPGGPFGTKFIRVIVH